VIDTDNARVSSNSSWLMPPPSPPEPPAASSSTLDNKISPSIVFALAILAILFFVCGLLHLLARHLLRLRRQRRAREDGDSVTAFQGQLQQLFHLHDAGVDQAFIDALPVFLYRHVVGGKQDPLDCAVCPLRVLPRRPAPAAAQVQPRLPPRMHRHVAALPLHMPALPEEPPRRALAHVQPRRDGARVRELTRHGRAGGSASDYAGGEPGGAIGAAAEEAEEEVVEVKLGKFMCVEVNAVNASNAVASAADEAGTSTNGSGGANARAGLGQRRCHSMGSYEYVMDGLAPLCVAIKPPKKKPTLSKSGMSECEFGASTRGSLRLAAFPATAEKQPGTASGKLAKDSFSVSKTWMVPSKKDRPDAAGERRATSFRWPVVTKRGEGSNDRKSGSEAADLDVEAGGGERNSACSLVEERPSFARRKLLWVVGGGRHNRVGSCS
jgi:hypothetical protein